MAELVPPAFKRGINERGTEEPVARGLVIQQRKKP
jgi:hypothetical protein